MFRLARRARQWLSLQAAVAGSAIACPVTAATRRSGKDPPSAAASTRLSACWGRCPRLATTSCAARRRSLRRAHPRGGTRGLRARGHGTSSRRDPSTARPVAARAATSREAAARDAAAASARALTWLPAPLRRGGAPSTASSAPSPSVPTPLVAQTPCTPPPCPRAACALPLRRPAQSRRRRQAPLTPSPPARSPPWAAAPFARLLPPSW
mmetsp:Transcript_7912/g.31277  ORF Transcript_7912/g.31277 Transcript_7912/m.31277 type:complete len:210 (-) Transcript_7912:266-895(-)